MKNLVFGTKLQIVYIDTLLYTQVEQAAWFVLQQAFEQCSKIIIISTRATHKIIHGVTKYFLL